MNIFRLQLMADLLKEMTVAVPVIEVTGYAARHFEDGEEVTRVIEAFALDDWTNALGQLCSMDRPACGYSACAVGHAMFDVRFNALGLYHHEGNPAYEGKTSWTAVQEFFGINNRTAETLFSPCQYDERDEDDDDYDEDQPSAATPKDVLERVQFLLIEGELALNAKYRNR